MGGQLFPRTVLAATRRRMAAATRFFALLVIVVLLGETTAAFSWFGDLFRGKGCPKEIVRSLEQLDTALVQLDKALEATKCGSKTKCECDGMKDGVSRLTQLTETIRRRFGKKVRLNRTSSGNGKLFDSLSRSRLPAALRDRVEQVYMANYSNDFNLWFGEKANPSAPIYSWEVELLNPKAILGVRANAAVHRACQSLVEVRLVYRTTAKHDDNYLDHGTVKEMTDNLRSRYNATLKVPQLAGPPFSSSCVTKKGDCGATVPVYEYYSPEDIRYSLSRKKPGEQFVFGRVLCYFWHL